MGKASFHLRPVAEWLAEHLKRSTKLFMDETRVPVPLDPAGNGDSPARRHCGSGPPPSLDRILDTGTCGRAVDMIVCESPTRLAGSRKRESRSVFSELFPVTRDEVTPRPKSLIGRELDPVELLAEETP